MDFTKAISVTLEYMKSELDPKNLISHHINKLAGGQDSPAGEQAQIFSELTNTHTHTLIFHFCRPGFKTEDHELKLVCCFHSSRHLCTAQNHHKKCHDWQSLTQGWFWKSRKCKLGLKHTGTAVYGILCSLPTCLPKPNVFFSSWTSASATFILKKKLKERKEIQRESLQSLEPVPLIHLLYICSKGSYMAEGINLQSLFRFGFVYFLVFGESFNFFFL